MVKEVVLKGVHSSASVRNLQKNEGKKNQQKGKKKSKTSRPTSSPTAESINCVDGIALGTSCMIACNGKCCKDPDGVDACASFTGTVRKDGKSCMGYQAAQEERSNPSLIRVMVIKRVTMLGKVVKSAI